MRVRSIEQVDLPPDAFSIVMATGIVAVAADDHAYPWLSIPLGWIGVGVFVVLAGGLLVKVAIAPRTAVGELGDPDVALRLFTSVAACAVLGVRFLDVAWAVWLFGIAALAAWLLLVPIAARDVRSRPRDDLRDHAHGAWLLASVATAGLATTAADLATITGSRGLLIVGAIVWLLGLLFYIAVAWLIGYRAAAAPIVPARQLDSDGRARHQRARRRPFAPDDASTRQPCRNHKLGASDDLRGLDDRNSLDSVAAVRGDLANRSAIRILAVRRCVVGGRFSARHVFGGDRSNGSPIRHRRADDSVAGVLLGGVHRLVACGYRANSHLGAANARYGYELANNPPSGVTPHVVPANRVPASLRHRRRVLMATGAPRIGPSQ